ncbi:geranylgeranyl pyrophosphate synthase [Oxalobacteraceae bacterium GrIS 2.11]
MRANVLVNEISPSYLVSKPGALLDQVETCMSEVLQQCPATQLASHTDTAISASSDIHAAAIYHLQSGGQRLRARLALGAGQAIGLSEEDCIHIAAAVELLHNASLIHDDLQDKDKYRRGQESVWSKFSSNLAICCGDLYLSAAYGVLGNISKPAVLPKLFRQMHGRVTEAILGQSADLSIGANHMMLDTYIQVVMAKSGALLSLPLELIFLMGGYDEMIRPAQKACKHFAVGFQIYDDVCDFSADCGPINGSVGDEDRFNIVAVFNYLNSVTNTCGDPIAASKELAVRHLQLAQTSLDVLPQRSGVLLEECAQNIEELLGGLFRKN